MEGHLHASGGAHKCYMYITGIIGSSLCTLNYSSIYCSTSKTSGDFSSANEIR